MPHILFVVDYFPPHRGGVERLFEDLSAYISSQGIQLSVLTSRYDTTLKKIDKLGNTTVYRVGRSRWGFFWASIYFAMKHRHLMKSITHIHTSTYASALSARCIARYLKKPISITIHELYGELWYHLKGRKARYYVLYERIVTHLSRKVIITPSQYTRDTILQRYPKLISRQNIKVIYNQLASKDRSRDTINVATQQALRTKYGLTDDHKILLFVGQLGLYKGLAYVIEAYTDIARDFPHSKLVIIAPKTPSRYNQSTKGEISRTQNHISSNFLDKQVLWIDPVADEELKTRMTIAHRGLIPSISEGFGYIGIEMQALGLPVIASKSGSLPETLNQAGAKFVPYGKVGARRQALQEELSSTSPSSQNFACIHLHSEIDYQDYQELFTS